MHVQQALIRLLVVAGLVLNGPLLAQNRSRTEVPFPDVPGFVTLRCDLHLHTVFSDGELWPAARAEEAWRTGLDAIALTDHIEYLPHKNDLAANYGRAYEIARARAEQLTTALRLKVKYEPAE